MKLRFADASNAGVVRIPLEALVHRRDQDSVFVLELSATGTQARLRPIQIGRVSGTELLVRSGLRPGTRIVAEGAVFLQDQQSVRVLE